MLEQSSPTGYNGTIYRSRTEAHWAVFFDSMGIAFEYEPKLFVLPDGRAYLPDFNLTHINLFAEVKPDLESDVSKMKALVKSGQVRAMLLLTDIPACRPYQLLRGDMVMGEIETYWTNASLDVAEQSRRYRDEHRLYEGIAVDYDAWSDVFECAVQNSNKATLKHPLYKGIRMPPWPDSSLAT